MILDPILDVFRGKAVTIPPLDGAFRPNTRLDDAPAFAELAEPDNLLTAEGRLLVSSGNAVLAVAAGSEPAVVETFQSPVTALAISPTGELTVGLENGKLLIAGKEVSLPAELMCITALAYAGDGTLWLANGSAQHLPSQWAADLMKKGASGSLWRCGPGGIGFQRIAGYVAFPYGLHPIGNDVLVSESWRHQLVRFDGASGNRSTVLTHLPGYPARLSPAGDGGARWRKARARPDFDRARRRAYPVAQGRERCARHARHDAIHHALHAIGGSDVRIDGGNLRRSRPRNRAQRHGARRNDRRARNRRGRRRDLRAGRRHLGGVGNAGFGR